MSATTSTQPPITGLIDRIRRASNLPSPPAVAARLIEIADDPDLSLTKVVEILRVDPALTAKLLRLANSPLYARRRHIETLQQAVTLLGLDAVLTAALSLTLIGDTESTRSTSTVFRSQWSRSVHAAVAAQALAARCAGVPPADAFLAALVQDIGVLVIARLEPSTYGAGPSNHATLIAEERSALDIDHATAGAELLAEWNLPNHIVEAVRDSHRADVDPQRPLDAVVAVSGMIADAVAGDTEMMAAVRDHTAKLGLTTETVNEVLDAIAAALPPLASLLDASVPPADRLAEMASELIMERMISSQLATDELRQQFDHAAETASILVEQNRLDPLTRQLNRRTLELALDEHVEQWNRFGWPFGVLFIDVDHFKHVNDTFGHRTGDEVLTLVAAQISQHLRHGDLCGRYGGDEFVVILPTVATAQACIVAERIVTAVHGNPVRVADGALHHQTVSIGVAATDALGASLTRHALLDAADGGLYRAKHAGRSGWAIGSPA